LKPFIHEVAATIDLDDLGNEFPPTSLTEPRYTQRLSIIPVDESELYGDNFEGQFFPHGDKFDVAVNHTIHKDDHRIRKGWWWWELGIPALGGGVVVARFRMMPFRGGVKKGTYTAVLENQGMWKYWKGGERGDLHVRMNVI
jgi:hypothetical protein